MDAQITQALASGWYIESGMLVPPRGHPASGWTGRWQLVEHNGVAVHVPNYLKRAMAN